MADSPREPESALYQPVKDFLAAQGYDVKGEVKGCDLVAVRGADPPIVVELKRSFGLGLVLQGIDRLALTDAVYLAVGAWPSRLGDVKKLCRRVGLGFLVVVHGKVEVVLDPLPYQPRKNRKRIGRLLGEHARRIGDPTRGGSTRQPIMTAYRQEALRCAVLLVRGDPMRVAELRAAADLPNVASILQRNVYGWFERVARGVYTLTPQGKLGLERFGYAAPQAPVAKPRPKAAA